MATSSRDKRCRSGIAGRRKDTDILLPYGEAQNGRMLHISEVPSGLRCGCKCPDCGAPLVARKDVEKEHHFAHHAGAACGVSLESALHKVAKQVIAEHRQVWLPPVEAIAGGRPRVRHEGRMFQVSDVIVEQWLDGLRPDIIVRKNGHELLVEVAVTHFCDEAKVALIRGRQLAAIEIDLSGVPRGASRTEIENAILRSAPRDWLFNAHLDELLSEIEAEKKQETAHRAAQKERAIRGKVSALMVAWHAKPDTAGAKAVRDAIAPQLAELSDAKLLDEIGHDVGDDRCFTVDRKTWQAAILHHVITPDWPHTPVKATEILKLLTNASLVKPGLVGFVDQEVSDHARAAELNFMSPFEAVEEYLDLLKERGVLQGRSNGYPVTNMQIVRDALVAVKHAKTSRRQVADVRRALDLLLSDMGNPPSVSPTVWMRTRHAGLDDAPEIVAARHPSSADGLIYHLGRLRNMIGGDGAVEERLLGLPLEEARERRRIAIAAEAEAVRLKEECRRAVAIARERQEAETRRDRLASSAYDLLGQIEGEKFVMKPFDCLARRSLSNVDGLDEEQERMVDRALGTEHRRVQAELEQERAARNRRDRLQTAAESAFGPKGLRSG